MEQLSMFDLLYEDFKIDKPLRTIEFFAGYGSQALALKYLGVQFEHWKIAEWAVKSIQAYKDMHFAEDDTDYSKDLSKEEIVSYLYEKGISSNYNEPMKEEQIKRLSEEQVRTIYNNLKATHNLVSVCNIKGQDLEIKDTDKYTYLLTYSFPCQDLSLAGLGKGMADTSTRSGLLWEVERILSECKEIGTLPQVLLMENVPQVHGEGNKEHFIKWIDRLEELGYQNYYEDLIATDYGIPQIRNRCFMVSVLGDYNYRFPKPVPLKLKLKDMLEDNVDEKYYLSDSMINFVCSRMPSGNHHITTGINMGTKESLEKAGTITTCSGNRPTDNFLIENEEYDYSKKDGKIINKHLKEKIDQNDENNSYLSIKNAAEKRYLGTYNYNYSDNFMNGKDRFNPDKDVVGTILTTHSDGIVECNEEILKRTLCNELIRTGQVEEGDVVKHSYTRQILDGNKKCVEKNDGVMITLTTRGDCVGVAVNDKPKFKKDTENYIEWEQKGRLDVDCRAFKEDKVISTITTSAKDKVLQNNLRIRKLTPKECFRLMGVKDEDYERVAKHQSNASLYHLAGDSIVVDVLMAIFKEMMNNETW